MVIVVEPPSSTGPLLDSVAVGATLFTVTVFEYCVTGVRSLSRILPRMVRVPLSVVELGVPDAVVKAAPVSHWNWYVRLVASTGEESNGLPSESVAGDPSLTEVGTDGTAVGARFATVTVNVLVVTPRSLSVTLTETV